MRTMQVAQRAGVNAQTLRYYERRGLLPDPPRTASGYRAYGPEAVRIVRFVKRAQELGFSLTEIEVLLHLADGGPSPAIWLASWPRTRSPTWTPKSPA
jgi:DNA-binding transcriptional MerR regulator